MDKATKEARRAEDEQHTQVRGLLRACDLFLELNGRLPLRSVQVFLAVAERPGQSVGDYAQRCALSPSTTSRNLLDIGERNRWMERGLGLVIRGNSRKRRDSEYYLTTDGETLLRKVLAQVR